MIGLGEGTGQSINFPDQRHGSPESQVMESWRANNAQIATRGPGLGYPGAGQLESLFAWRAVEVFSTALNA